MEENRYKDKISIKKIVNSLVKDWRLIFSITIIVTMLGGGYIFVIADSIYESKIEGIISIPEKVGTKYGDYIFSSNNSMDYLSVIKSSKVLNETIERLDLEMTAKSLEERIIIINSENSSLFSFSITANTASEAKEILEVLVECFLEELKMIYKEKAIEYFTRVYFVEFESYQENEIRLKEKLKNTENILMKTEPVVLLNKLVLNDSIYAAKLASERGINISDLSGELMLEEEINPHYEELQGEIINLEQQLNDLRLSKEQTKRYLYELNIEKQGMVLYKKNKDVSQMTEGLLEVMESNVLVNDNATFSENPIAPNKKLLMIISILLGSMTGVFVAFLKVYWKNEMQE